MPVSAIVYSFVSALGALSAAAVLAASLGLLAVPGAMTLWGLFLACSVLGPAGLVMSSRRPGRTLVALGVAFAAIGVVALAAVFAGALGWLSDAMPTLPLLALALLTVPGGLALVLAGRASALPGGSA